MKINIYSTSISVRDKNGRRGYSFPEINQIQDDGILEELSRLQEAGKYDPKKMKQNWEEVEAQLQADEPTEQEIAQRRSKQAESEARKIIMERLIEKELEKDEDIKSLIEQAKSQDNPGQFMRDEIQKLKK